MTTMTSNKDVNVDVVAPFCPASTRNSIPQLLAARQVGNPAVTPTKLSSVVAWNVHRLQNMIVAVGPGTPAAATKRNFNHNAYDASIFSSSSSSSSSLHAMEEDDDDEDSNQDENSQEEPSHSRSRRSRHRQEEQDMDTVMMEQVLMEYLHPLDDHEEEDVISQPNLSSHTTATRTAVVPGMRHAGCINTATWLTSPWRLSCSDNSDVTAVECSDVPSQIITSGDDKTVKFWDVSRAMGMDNPWPGGKYSKCPFADYSNCTNHNDEYRHADCSLAGSVIPLVSVETGHRSNVFHVTPVDAHAGSVLTCGADGCLRLSNVTRPQHESSTVVWSPRLDHLDELLPLGLFSLRTDKIMCFSHHLLTAHTGLLCGERGLFSFDLRVAPREQSTRSLLGDNGNVCKSVAIWSTDSMDSAYVFAGGASSEVALYDLRMTDASASRVVQKYRPSGLQYDSEVSVSGLDVSRDKRELLVSYENDQVFAFPVFPNSPGGRPSIDEMEDYSNAYSGDEEGPILSELAAYGGHLNRFTFLKNAKYAGPQDEYICTGSDSGRAWIYERATGTVAAFLAADQSTCNGVMPHPSLPFFITYGIDSTAKLWRATPPVDRDADDSPLGRAREHHRQQYEKSTLVRSWSYAKATAGSIATLDDDDDEADEAVTIYPDQFPVSESPSIGNSILGSILMRRRMFGMGDTRTSGICNDLGQLSNILQKNLFSCIIASEEGESEPVSSGLSDLVRRMSTIRLRFQADQRGLVWIPNDPWAFAALDFYKGAELAQPFAGKTSDPSKRESTLYGNPYDLIPESPSDWLPYDPEMTKTPLPCGPRFNVEDYDDFYHERYSQLGLVIEETKTHGTAGWRETTKQTDQVSESSTAAVGKQVPTPTYDSERALQLLYETALMLKEGGNAALESGSTMEAARRYDCAIRYCSVAILAHPNANTDLIQATERKWCPLRKLLVSTRLNLCMVLANFDLRGARDQATLALKELAPFCTQPGKILGGKKLSTVYNEDEPMSTYQEAKEFQAKAYFRHGSVDFKVGDYDEAVDEFEESIKCTKELSKEPDRVLLRRLAEAKREKVRKSKRQKRKFRRMLAKEALKDEEDDSSEG